MFACTRVHVCGFENKDTAQTSAGFILYVPDRNVVDQPQVGKYYSSCLVLPPISHNQPCSLVRNINAMNVKTPLPPLIWKEVGRGEHRLATRRTVHFRITTTQHTPCHSANSCPPTQIKSPYPDSNYKSVPRPKFAACTQTQIVVRTQICTNAKLDFARTQNWTLHDRKCGLCTSHHRKVALCKPAFPGVARCTTAKPHIPHCTTARPPGPP